MPNLDLPILIVDDAKFSSTIIAKTLTKAGYRDLRIANDAPTGLEMLEQRKAGLLIADWLMPDMDGLELSHYVRQMDEQQNHFTYIILLTGKESDGAIVEAFDKGVDDFVLKSNMTKELLPRVYAADRMSDQQNTLLRANQLLIENNQYLEANNRIDKDTGIGNPKYATVQLERMLKHVEGRGGAISYLIMGIKNWQQIKDENNPVVSTELVVGIARRMRHLIRPMDNLCRIDENQFAIVAQFSSIDHCTLSCYKRIHDGINHKAFRTSAGYISVKAGTSVCTIDGRSTLPAATEIENSCKQQLLSAYETDTITISRWRAEP